MTGKEFRDWMTANRYSVRVLAHDLGLSPRTVQRMTGAEEVPRLWLLALRGLLDLQREQGEDVIDLTT